MIVSHYLYLIGPSPLQSNIVGFYSSLMQQLLAGDGSSDETDLLVNEVFRQLPFAASKKYLADWPIPELGNCLRRL